MKHRYKSIEGAARRIRQLEKTLSFYERFTREQDHKLRLVARLSAKTPQFSNPLEVFAAEKVRDDILCRIEGKAV